MEVPRDSAGSETGTPSEGSSHDIEEEKKFESDSDYESYNGGDSNDASNPNVLWIGQGRSIPIVFFDVEGFFRRDPSLRAVGEKYNLKCKVTGDSQILREILAAHGFQEVDLYHRHYNLAWSGRHVRPASIHRMAEWHVINHFPRTDQITRKDKLYRNIMRMQLKKGKDAFDFVPVSFTLPKDYSAFCSHFKKDQGLYIVKPVCLSRGRGVFLINDPEDSRKIDVQRLQEMSGRGDRQIMKTIVSKYITNPLTIYGYKFDLRIYVALTSVDPLVIYVYREGLVRLATVKYDMKEHDHHKRCMHLTNYSLNMMSGDYVKNVDPEVENFGNKWSLGALLRHLRSKGVDTIAVMKQIEAVIIKTILSIESKVGAACRKAIVHSHNCFELFGFDILLDENYKPWLLEVNLSPSLGCDTPIDVKIKCNMLCDLLTLVGVRCFDSHLGKQRSVVKSAFTKLKYRLEKSYGYHYCSICREALEQARYKHRSKKHLKTMMELEKCAKSRKPGETLSSAATNLLASLRPKEVQLIREVKEEEARKGGWQRIFPTCDSWDDYKDFMDFPTINNLLLHQRLYPEKHSVMTAGKSQWAGTVTPSESMMEVTLQMTGQKLESCKRVNKSYIEFIQRYEQYETPLQIVPPPHFHQKPGLGGDYEEISSATDSSDDEPVISNRIGAHDRNSVQEISSIPAANMFSGSSEELCHQSRIHREDVEMEAHVERQLYEGIFLGEPNRIPQPILSLKNLDYDVISLLEQGYEMSEKQGRLAFASYLLHILKGILLNFEATMKRAEANHIPGLMKLVMQFLTQAPSLMPSSSQPDVSGIVCVSSGRKKLARLLADFICVYMQDSESLSSSRSSEIDDMRTQENTSFHLDEIQFEKFICRADIKEVEKVLMLYAKGRDPMATFLGRTVVGDISL